MDYTREQIRRAMALYAVTDRAWLKPGQRLEDVCAQALDGGATFLQLREKQLDEKSILAEAAVLGALCRQRGVPFVVNDSIELALASGADGVHLGQSDLHGRDVRALLGPGRILGISAGTVEQAIAAEGAGADYIGVGAVFPTGTIGGINEGNIMSLAGSGVSGVAVVSAIFAADDPAGAAASLRSLAERAVARG